MDKDKSILEKITDTIQDIANIAADAADHALKAEQPRPQVDQRAAAYIPLAADGLVSDPMMVPPLAATPAPRRKRAPSTRAAKQTRSKTARKAVSKSAGNAAKKTAARPSASAATRTAKKTSKKMARTARKGIR
jgi:hypothetical protein